MPSLFSPQNQDNAPESLKLEGSAIEQAARRNATALTAIVAVDRWWRYTGMALSVAEKKRLAAPDRRAGGYSPAPLFPKEPRTISGAIKLIPKFESDPDWKGLASDQSKIAIVAHPYLIALVRGVAVSVPPGQDVLASLEDDAVVLEAILGEIEMRFESLRLGPRNSRPHLPGAGKRHFGSVFADLGRQLDDGFARLEGARRLQHLDGPRSQLGMHGTRPRYNNYEIGKIDPMDFQAELLRDFTLPSSVVSQAPRPESFSGRGHVVVDDAPHLVADRPADPPPPAICR